MTTLNLLSHQIEISAQEKKCNTTGKQKQNVLSRKSERQAAGGC